MDVSQYLIKIINNKLQAEPKLDYEETINVLTALCTISEEKVLIEKLIELTNFLHNIQHNKELLSKREIQVFELIGKGYMSAEIAFRLNISTATVSTHRKNILKKLKLNGRKNAQNFVIQYFLRQMKNEENTY